MKANIRVYLIAIIMVGLTGCGSNTASNTGSTNTNSISTKASENKNSSEYTETQTENITIDVANGVVQLKFRDTLSEERLKQLEGKTVTMSGFMAAMSPLDGSFFYLMDIPYQTCPFCVPNTNQLANTMAVYPPSNRKITFSDAPVQVTGVFKLGEIEDSMGYTYQYRIMAAKVSKADTSTMNPIIQNYEALAKKGFAASINNILQEVYVRANYKQKGTNENDLKPIDISDMTAIEDMFQELDKSKYQDILSTVDKLHSLVTKINVAIEKKDWETLTSYTIEGQAVYTEYSLWITKPKL